MNKTTKLNEKIVELASLPSKSTLAHKKFTDRRNFFAVSANSLLVEKYLNGEIGENRKALEKHRRFFEMLAQAFGMILKGWGPERHVDWEGAAW